jgi:HAD superfamily hydrolase (TIGR01509 family)
MDSKLHLVGVLFDWDGTLVDSYHADSQAYLGMFQALGLSWGMEELAANYAPDWYAVYRAAGIPQERWNDADRLWRTHYAKHHLKLLTGARQVLRVLGKGYRLGLVTSGDRERVRRQLRSFGLMRVFRTRVCGEDTREKKPHPAPLLLALKRMKLGPAECVYVGDTPEDLAMAKAVGMRAIAVMGPFPVEKRLRAAKPEFLLERLADLPQLLRQLYPNSGRGKKGFEEREKAQRGSGFGRRRRG